MNKNSITQAKEALKQNKAQSQELPEFERKQGNKGAREQGSKNTSQGQPLNFRIDPELHRRLRIYAAQNDQTQKDVVSQALKTFLDEQESKG